jgi:hypothetical protein
MKVDLPKLKYPVNEVVGEFVEETRSNLEYGLELFLQEIINLIRSNWDIYLTNHYK